MRIPRPLAIMKVFVISLLLLFPIYGFATESGSEANSELAYVGEQDGLYRYQLPGGTGFFSTVQQGEQNALMAAFRIDEGLSYNLLLEGEPVEYFSEVLVTTPGSYQLLVTDSSRGEADIFIFSITSTTAEDVKPFKFGKIVHDPPMTIGLDEEKSLFSYTFPNGASYSASLPSGGITTESLAVVFPEGMKATLFYNDDILPYKSGDRLTEEGVYRLQLVQPPKFSPNADDNNTYVSTYYARILKRSSSHLELLYPPVGFVWGKITLNEEPIAVQSSTGALRLAEDGFYKLTLDSTFAPGLQYHLTLSKDTQPPLIVFSEGGLAGYSDVPVCFAPYDQNTIITVVKNGIPQEGINVLAEDGTYRLTATDTAGNIRIYTVRIKLRDNFRVTPRFLIFLAILLVLAAVVMLRARKQTQVI